MAELVVQSVASLVPPPASVADMPPGNKEKDEDRKKLNLKVYEQFAREKDGQLKMTDEQEVANQRGYCTSYAYISFANFCQRRLDYP